MALQFLDADLRELLRLSQRVRVEIADEVVEADTANSSCTCRASVR